MPGRTVREREKFTTTADADCGTAQQEERDVTAQLRRESLHHIDLPAALGAIRAVLVPGGLLAVNEFDWPAYDARAAAWVDEPESGDPVEQFHREHEDLHSRSAMLEAVGARFELREEVPRPYLARMLRRSEREPDERAAIGAGRVPALGFWLVAAQPAEPVEAG